MGFSEKKGTRKFDTFQMQIIFFDEVGHSHTLHPFNHIINSHSIPIVSVFSVFSFPIFKTSMKSLIESFGAEKSLKMGLSENRLNPIVPNGFADHYPYEKWLAIININPRFSGPSPIFVIHFSNIFQKHHLWWLFFRGSLGIAEEAEASAAEASAGGWERWKAGLIF